MATPEVAYPRRIMVDDTDPRIVYDSSDSWDLDISSFNNAGRLLGDPYNKTMSGTTSAQTGFAFTFEGDFVQVRGAKDNSKIPRSFPNSTFDSLDLFPQYRCQIDNQPVVPVNYSADMYDTTNLVLCEGAHLSKTNHTLVMNVTVDDPSRQVFWLDSIEYSPLSITDLTHQVLKVDSSDIISCSYHNGSNEWGSIAGDFDTTNATLVPGATMSFRFNGTSVALYGINTYRKDGGQLDATTGTYYIDNGKLVSFNIPGSIPLPYAPQNNTGWANQLVFTTDSVDGGKEHEMVVTYSGVSKGTNPAQALVIDYFYVANDGTQVQEDRADSKKVPVGAIVGGVVGGVLGLIAVAGLVWFMMKKMRGREKVDTSSNDGTPIVMPFNDMAERWTGEPLRDSRVPEVGTEESVFDDARTANFSSMKHAQRVAVSEQVTQERDSGLRYSKAPVSPPLGAAVRLPPVYTPA
ncbi:hypothetical protein AAF712_011440 [Marasmius tenuissimus]|uniref:Ig-like domain-containing protein n=1 Tax=Marasmius tenuissimus TaxID=585030 RepID=A0ABR2ZK75_9AGAR